MHQRDLRAVEMVSMLAVERMVVVCWTGASTMASEKSWKGHQRQKEYRHLTSDSDVRVNLLQ